MEAGNSPKFNAPPLPTVEANVVVAAAAPEADWHSVSLAGSLRSETENCFLLSEGKRAKQPPRTVDLSMCGFSKLIGGGADDSGPILGHGDDGCLPLLQQVRAFINAAKLSCAGFSFEDGKPFFNGWSSLLQPSFSFESSPSSTSEIESLCKESNSSALNRSASSSTLKSSICNTVTPDALKARPPLARDPSSGAEALRLARYRPTDGAIWKEGDSKTVQSITASKSLVNCKKPPKPPRHPGRSASLDSATLAAQRAAKKCRDRASTKRKSRVVSAAASTGLTALVAVVLTIGFGLMVFQGVFVQTSVSYGRNANGFYVDVAANSRPTLLARKFSSYKNFHPIDPHLPASLNIDLSNSEAIMKGALQQSMTNVPWSRSLLTSQILSTWG